MAFVRHSSWKLLPLSFHFVLCQRNGALRAPQVPCYFIFWDSISDAGSNNNLISLAKVNDLPYGINFPDGPTGRFTNGPSIVDFIARLLGFDHYIQNFRVALANEDFIRGVNYAPGAAGIRDKTGIQQGDPRGAGCRFTVGMEHNDYINNYFMPQFNLSSRFYTPQQFATALAKQYAQQLTALYRLLARKVAILGPGLLGCAPQGISTYVATNGST